MLKQHGLLHSLRVRQPATSSLPSVGKPKRRVSLFGKQIESSKKQTSSKAESRTDGKTGSLQASITSTAKQGRRDPVLLRTGCMRRSPNSYCQKNPTPFHLRAVRKPIPSPGQTPHLTTSLSPPVSCRRGISLPASYRAQKHPHPHPAEAPAAGRPPPLSPSALNHPAIQPSLL